MKPIKAFILAAGFGERLKPITDHLPKPLLPVLGKPILQCVLERLTSIPAIKIGINVHYKSEMILEWLTECGYSDILEIFHENEVLGTGGGLKNAESFLNGSDFLVHNSDIISNIDLKALIENHVRSGNILTLAVHNHSRFNNVWIDKNGSVRVIAKSLTENSQKLRSVAFTGISVYAPRIFEFIPPGRSSVVDVWIAAISAGHRIGTADFTGCDWTDIGTPGAYSHFVLEALKKEGELLYIHPSVEVSGTRVGANTIIENGSRIGSGTALNRCIVLPGADIPENSKAENVIIGADYKVPIDEQLTIPASLPSSLLSDFLGNSGGGIKISLIGTGGSDRRYYRVENSEKTAILMECPGSDGDFQRHLIYTHFFRKWSVPVPQLLASESGGSGNPALVKRAHLYALFEDLGDFSLYSWAKSRKTSEEITTMYRKVMDILANLHTLVTEKISECLLLKSRVFDYEHLLWESSYFISKFVTGMIGVVPSDEVRRECEDLAVAVNTFPKTIIHRDFQSQNVLIAGGEVPRVIDYQGARVGPPAYDLASILWDPYSVLVDGVRTELLEYYVEKAAEKNSSFLKKEFLQTVLPCRLQRHMQALGAYAFLSKEKGKLYFTKYIPAALHALREDTELAMEKYPALYSLVRDLNGKIEH